MVLVWCVVVVGFDIMLVMVDVLVVGVWLCDVCNGMFILLVLML